MGHPSPGSPLTLRLEKLLMRRRLFLLLVPVSSPDSASSSTLF